MIAKDDTEDMRYELVQLDDQTDIDFTRKQNAQSWKAILSEEDYVTREMVLSKAPLASSDEERLYVFQLADAETRSVRMCSIELWVRRGIKFYFNSSTGDVEKKSVLTGCIGGVFTYKEHRGKGYARIMVDKLCQKAREDILGPEGFIFLYSEIGEYYAKSGFKSFHVPLIHIPIAPPVSSESLYTSPVLSSSTDNGDEVKFIKYHEFGDYLKDWNVQLQNEITEKVKKDHKSRVALRPNSKIVDWFHLRSKYLSFKIFSEGKHLDFYEMNYDQIVGEFENLEPSTYGIKVSDRKGNTKGVIIWTSDWRSEANKVFHTVTVLKIIVYTGYDRTQVSNELIKLLKSYLESLYNEDLPIANTEKIIIWESEITEETKTLLSESLHAQTGIENGSRSAISINNANDHQDLLEGKLVWEGNDKLPWF